MWRRSIRAIAAAAALAATLSLAATAEAADFPTIVRAILNAQTDGALAGMSPQKRGLMTNCVVDTLQALPEGQKRQIVAGADLDAQEHTFGQVVMANRAAWKKKIAAHCSQIALGRVEDEK
jgi:hypothetical protein